MQFDNKATWNDGELEDEIGSEGRRGLSSSDRKQAGGELVANLRKYRNKGLLCRLLANGNGCW